MTDHQPSLWEEAEERREVGMTISSDNAGATWNAQAIEMIKIYLATHDEFFGDDFWEWAEPRGLEFRGRALGAIVRLAAKEGWMVKKGYRPSVRSNLSPKVLWESRL